MESRLKSTAIDLEERASALQAAESRLARREAQVCRSPLNVLHGAMWDVLCKNVQRFLQTLLYFLCLLAVPHLNRIV